MAISVEMIGLVAGGCTTLAFVPQVWKVWRSRSVKDISIWMYLIFCSGLAMWVMYGIYLRSTPLILANLTTFGLASAILIMKILWNRSN